jgi:hypothetical protein
MLGDITKARSNREGVRQHPGGSGWAVLVLLALSLPLLAATSEEPGILLRANPPASIAPGGRMQSILLSAQIVGPEVEEFYCPEIVWLLPNGRSAVESDCDPFNERRHYPRFFKRWVQSPPRIRNYKVCVEVRKADALLDDACVHYLVR